MKKVRGVVARLVIILVAVSTAVLSIAGQTSMADLSSVPTGGAGDSYEITVQFADVLNVPDSARVMLDGVAVGRLVSVKPADDYVEATLSIGSDHELPVGTRAELLLPTLLGDVFVGLDTSSAAADAVPIEPGGVIPLRDTSPPSPVEDLLSNLALISGNGALSRMLNTASLVPGAWSDDPDKLRTAVHSSGRGIVELGKRAEVIDDLVNSLNSSSKRVLEDTVRVGEYLTPEGAEHSSKVVESVIRAFDVFSMLGQLGHSVKWAENVVVPLDDAAAAYLPLLVTGNPFELNTASNVRVLLDLVVEKLVPWATGGMSIDVAELTLQRSAGVDSPQNRVSEVVSMLARLGVVG